MPELTSSDLQLALAQVRKDFGPARGISSVRLVSVKGIPTIVLMSSAPGRPSGIPSRVRLRLKSGKTIQVPILWRNSAHASNQQMWGGSTPVTQLLPRLIQQGKASQAPEIPTGQMIPADDADYQFMIGARRPAFAVPSYWSKPFDISGTVCIPTYNTWVNVLAHQTPATEMIVLTGASYEFNDCLQLLDVFQIQVQETGIGRNAMWYDMLAQNNPDPAFQFAFSGHCQPIPLTMVVDHDQTVTARMQVLGQIPFSNSPSTKLGGCGTLYLHGWISKLTSPLDVGYRGFDTGSIAEGGDGMLGDITPGGVE